MQASDPTFPLYPVFAFLAFVLSVIPLPWHLQAWNSGTCAFMIWVASCCLVLFINSLLWPDNAINFAPVWCDISIQIIGAAGVGIPASTLCISRRLYRITSTQTVSITRDDKRRLIYEDIAIAAGLPVLVMLLHIIVQPHRFDVLEEYGCSLPTYNTLPSYFLYYMWPVLIGLVSFFYSSLILRTFYMRRIQFNQILASNNNVNPSRYLRLMLLALIDIMCTLPLGIYIIYIDLKGVQLAPWISWADTHFDFGRVLLIPSVIWRSNPADNSAIQINRWLPVAFAFVFFALFGFAEEAMINYRRAFWFFARRLGLRPVPERGIAKGGVHAGLKKFKLKPDVDILPVYVVPTDPAIPSARPRKEIRISILDPESRSTICFPDDGIELGPYYKTSSATANVPSSPVSSTSTYSPRPPLTPTVSSPSSPPPSYVDSTPALASKADPGKKASWVTLPEFTLETSEHDNQSHGSNTPKLESESVSVSASRMNSEVPLLPPLPILPPPAVAFDRTFYSPSASTSTSGRAL